MDELLRRYGAELDEIVENGTYVVPYTSIGFLAKFARSVLDNERVNRVE